MTPSPHRVARKTDRKYMAIYTDILTAHPVSELIRELRKLKDYYLEDVTVENPRMLIGKVTRLRFSRPSSITKKGTKAKK